MKHFIALSILLATALHCDAQNANLNSKYAVKLYNLISWEDNSLSNTNAAFSIQTADKNSSFLHPTIAFRVRSKKRNFHEFELTNFELNSKENSTIWVYPNNTSIPIKGNTTTKTNIAFRYEHTMNFMKQKDSKWMPALGFAVMPYYERTKVMPVLSNEYSISDSQLGLKAFVVPRINYAISSKLFVDFNMPLCIINMSVEKGNTPNPNLTAAEQNTSTFNFNVGNDILSFRLGVGLNI